MATSASCYLLRGVPPICPVRDGVQAALDSFRLPSPNSCCVLLSQSNCLFLPSLVPSLKGLPFPFSFLLLVLLHLAPPLKSLPLLVTLTRFLLLSPPTSLLGLRGVSSHPTLPSPCLCFLATPLSFPGVGAARLPPALKLLDEKVVGLAPLPKCWEGP